ncbi:MAG: hypothetical protein HXX11_19665 [Desulfuromonadales bacterium]|nr:hypothetical protein [Desulfuromonadales bacterium]
MKVYLFNTENGLYEGETFVAADMLEDEEGVTTVAPPAHQTGFVPIFEICQQKWILRPVAQVRDQFMGRKGTRYEDPCPCSD